MDATLTKYLSLTIDPDNYLLYAKNNSLQYLSDFIPVYETYLANFPKEVNAWLANKMMLNGNKFNEKQFIQFACEATIVKYFAGKYKTNLGIEKKVNPNNRMDVDLVFDENGFTFNIEIKCSDFIAKEKLDNSNNLKIQPIGRLENFGDALRELQVLFKPIADKLNLDGIVPAKSMDNNLKDFLLSANNKFKPSAASNELNILSVSCNDAEDMQIWYYYMFKDDGLFTQNSFHPKSEFENVDVVILNNLYFKHNKYFTKKLLNSWDFANCFNLIFVNPFSKQKKEAAIIELLKICPNYNKELKTWKMPSDVEEEVKDSRRIANLIKAELEKNQGVFLFEQP